MRDTLHILVVEDSDDAVRLLEMSLWNQQRARVDFSRAGSLGEAIDLLDGDEFDAALVDLGLPDTQGLQAVEGLRRRAPELPIVVLTAAGEHLALDALRAGAQDYLGKEELTGPTVVRSLLFAMERGRNQRQLADLAYRDQLTGAASRPATAEAISDALQRLEGDGWVAVIFMDVNRFKAVNDRFGHNVGDRVLQDFGARLLAATRQNELVGRWAGDEFVIVTSGTGPTTEAQKVATRLEEILREPPVLDPEGDPVTATIGLAVTTDPRTSPDELVGAADSSMYEIKRARGAVGV